MMHFIRDLLSAKSDLSMMRFMSACSLFVAGGIACFGVYAGKDLMGLSALCGVFLGAGFGGKVSQKMVESKSVVERND